MQVLTQLAMYYKCGTSVVLSDGIVSEQLLLAKLRSYTQLAIRSAQSYWLALSGVTTLINVYYIVVTSEPYLSKQEFDSLRDQLAKSVVEKLFLLNNICLINFRGFHCPQIFLMTNYFQTTVCLVNVLFLGLFYPVFSSSLFSETHQWYSGP